MFCTRFCTTFTPTYANLQKKLKTVAGICLLLCHCAFYDTIISAVLRRCMNLVTALDMVFTRRNRRRDRSRYPIASCDHRIYERWAKKAGPQTHDHNSVKSEPIKEISLEDSLVNLKLNGY